MTEQLLSEISTIVNAYKIVRKANGGDFNIYKILGVSSAEVKTHSKFLAELLNPNGSHGQDDVFLQLFLKQVGLSDSGFITEKAKAFVEHYIGPKTETTGGRIDILIVDENNKRIIIENKIYAGDQENQLLRYYNFDKNAKLLYLTLEGNSPSDWSTGGKLEDKDYINISYQIDIIQWLENCKKEAVNFPILRESIGQYIHLIQYLTNQTSNNEMSKNVSEIILRTEINFSTFLELKKHRKQIYIDFWEKIFIPQFENVATAFGLTTIYIRNVCDRPVFAFINDKLKEGNIVISFVFDSKKAFFNDLSYGFSYIEKEKTLSDELLKNIREKFDERFGWKSYNNEWRLAYLLQSEEYRHWNDEMLLEIYRNPNENAAINEIRNKVTNMLEIIKEVLG